MKLNPLKGVALWVMLSFLCTRLPAQQLQWFANDHFEIVETSTDEWSVFYQKQPWEAFTLDAGEMDFSQSPVLDFEVQSDQPVSLRIDLLYKDGQQATGESQTIWLKGGKAFTKIKYNFADQAKRINPKTISHFHFYVNSGKQTTGELTLKNIQLPIPNTKSPTVRIFPNPVREKLTIHANDLLFDEIILFDIQGRIVAEKKLETTDQVDWEISALPAGTYGCQINYQQKIICTDQLIIK